MFISKIPTIGTGVCMFVGNFLQLGRYHKVVDLKRAGAAIGSLGRHTQITPDGMPVFDHRVEVLFKVGPDILKPVYLMVPTRTFHRSPSSRN